MSRRFTFVTFLVFSAAALPANAQVGKSASQPDEESSARPRDAADYVRRDRLSGSATPCAGDAFTHVRIFVNGTYETLAPTTVEIRARPTSRIPCSS